METRRTHLLIALLVATALASGAAWSWQEKRRQAAEGSFRDLAVCQADIADLARWNAGPTSDAPLTADNPELNRRLHEAAIQAGMPEELASIDPGQPRQIRDTEYSETLVFLRLSSVTLRQLVTFLHWLSAHDPGVRTKSIELGSTGSAPTEPANETWTADVSLAYLSYSPRPRPSR